MRCSDGLPSQRVAGHRFLVFILGFYAKNSSVSLNYKITCVILWRNLNHGDRHLTR